MIPTEEQRAALKRVVAYMDEMYAIASPYYGCTEDVDLLRAMIDSSEQFSDATKLIGFYLEKARAMICHYRIENPGDADTDCGLEDLIRQANLAEEALDEIERLNAHINSACIESLRIAEEQAAEIERLRAALDESEQILAHKTKTATHWYEEGLKTRADLVQSKRVVEQQAARIQELEDAHKRSGAKYAKIINELRSSVYANIPGLKKQWDEILNAPANGKIGPDAKPRSWQITEERKAAIDRGMRFLAWSNAKTNDPGTEIDLAVLRAMLTEAE